MIDRSSCARCGARARPRPARVIGGPQIRNRGTLGGNLAQRLAGGGHGAAALRRGRRGRDRLGQRRGATVPIEDFFTGPRKCVLSPGRADPGRARAQAHRRARRLPAARPAPGPGHLEGLGRGGMTFEDGRPTWVRVALGAVAPTVCARPRPRRRCWPAATRDCAARRTPCARRSTHRRPPLDARLPARDGGGAAGARGARPRRGLRPLPGIGRPPRSCSSASVSAWRTASPASATPSPTWRRWRSPTSSTS